MSLTGTTLNTYAISSLIGNGSNGVVYEAQKAGGRRRLALKILQGSLIVNPAFSTNFLAQMRPLQALDHPNIVELEDVFVQNDLCVLVMKFIPEGSTRALLKRYRNAGHHLPVHLALDIVRQAADGLAAAHARAIFHGEIKPENLMLTRREVPEADERFLVQIADFGVPLLSPVLLTSLNGQDLTPAYLSPERLQGLPGDQHSDLFALGVVLYELLTGLLPWHLTSHEAAVDYHMQRHTPPPPSTQRKDIPAELDALVKRMLDPFLMNRYQKATDVSMDLRGILNSQGKHPTVVLNAVNNIPIPSIPAITTFSDQPRIQVINQNGQVMGIHEITDRGLSIGRDASNDVILNQDQVSRYHLRLEPSGQNAEIFAIDLVSTNGSLVNGSLLTPLTPLLLNWGNTISIGPFWLRLEPPHVLPPVQRRVNLNIPPTIEVIPGKPIQVPVQFSNIGPIVEGLTLSVSGIANDWVTISPNIILMIPGDTLTCTLTLNVPKTPQALAGLSGLTVLARSEKDRTDFAVITTQINIAPFVDTNLRIKPEQRSGRTGATFNYEVTNNSNILLVYDLQAEDDAQKLRFRFEEPRVELQPGQRTDQHTGRHKELNLMVQTDRRWIGTAQVRDFHVTASHNGNSTALKSKATLVHQAVFPGWFPPMLLALLSVLGFWVWTLISRPPLIESFGLSGKTQPQEGKDFNVEWRANRADRYQIKVNGKVVIDNIEGVTTQQKIEGQLTSAKLTLVAINRFSRSEKELEVITELLEPVIKKFTVTPLKINSEQTVTVSWNVANATQIEVKNINGGGTVKATGSLKERVRDTKKYVLIATNGSKKVEKEIVLIHEDQTPNPVILKVEPETVQAGQKVKVSWDVTGAQEISLENISGGGTINQPKGFLTEIPDQNKTYTLVAKNGSKKVTKTAGIIVVGPPPPTIRFSIRPSKYRAGQVQNIRLEWNVKNANKISIAGVGDVASSGFKFIPAPTDSKDFQLDASNDAKSAFQVVSVVVVPKPVVEEFSVNPTTVQAGDKVTVKWKVTGADNGRITITDLGLVGPDGTNANYIPPRTKTLLLLVNDKSNGQEIARGDPVPVTVTPGTPVIQDFRASRPTITTGQTSRLSWKVSGATTVRLESIGNVTRIQGFKNVRPPATTTYKLIAENAAGLKEKLVTVTVIPLPTIEQFDITPSSVQKGGQVTLQWRVKDADTIKLTPGNITLTPNNTNDNIKSGTKTLILQKTTRYTLIASNSTIHSDSPPKIITVLPSTPNLPQIKSFTATPSSSTTPGAPVTFSWRVKDATGIVLQPGSIALQGTLRGNIRTGTKTVNPQVTTTYTLIARNSSGPVDSPVTVKVLGPDPCPSIAGRWIHNFGDLVISQNRSAITGYFHQDGNLTKIRLTGTCSGTTVTGSYKLAGQTKPFSWNVSQNGRTFEGTHAGSQRWCAAKNGTPLPDKCNFSGTWNTIVGNQNCQMTLSVKLSGLREIVNGNGTCDIGNFVGERYFGANGETTVSGRLSNGTDFRFRMTQIDAIQFQGKQGSNPWCGWRDNSSQPATCLLSN